MTHTDPFESYVERLSALIAPAAGDAQLPAAADFPFPARAFQELAAELFTLQRTHNAAYAAFCASRKVPGQPITDWRTIPAMPTVGFKELDLSSLPPSERVCTFHSSGTTEHRPSRHPHSRRSLALYESSLLAWFRPHLAPDLPASIPQTTPLIINLTPPSDQAPHSSLAHMLACVSQRFAAQNHHFVGGIDPQSGWILDVEKFMGLMDTALVSSNPVWLMGTAFNFVHLLDALQHRGLRYQLPEGSRVMETGGYKGRSRSLDKAELHAWISNSLGLSRDFIRCEYGMSELSSQAYDGGIPVARSSTDVAVPRIFRWPPWARCLLISPETGREVAEGEIGLIRVIDLANAYSVMAMQTEDLGRRVQDGFELVGRAPNAEQRGCSLLSLATSSAPGIAPQPG